MARTKLQTPNFNLSRRADGYYEIRYTVDGKPAKKSTGTKDPVKAETFRANFVKAFNEAKPSSDKPTVAEISDAYMAYRMPKVVTGHKFPYLFAPIKRHMGLIYAEDLTQSDCDNYTATRSCGQLS